MQRKPVTSEWKERQTGRHSEADYCIWKPGTSEWKPGKRDRQVDTVRQTIVFGNQELARGNQGRETDR